MADRKRMSVRALRRGMYVMAICGDADVPDFAAIAAPLKVTLVDTRDDVLVGVQLLNERDGISMGLGYFEDQAVAWVATAEDKLLLNGSPSSHDEDAPLGDVAGPSEVVMTEPPADWPRFPRKQTLPSQEQEHGS